MNELSKRLAKIKNRGEKALIPFLTAGDPNVATTETLMNVLAENGADVIELGVPYSDPLADGPVLQLAAGRALAGGTTTDSVFNLVARFRKNYGTPVVLLVYYNLIYHRGVETFCRQAAAAGVNGLVVPDLPFEEAEELDKLAENSGLISIRFLSPTTTAKRLEKICHSAKGFIYCVSVTGVTGERAAMDPEISGMLAKARTITDVTLAVGFGISNAKQAAQAAENADAVIVGTALVKRIAESETIHEKVAEAREFVRTFKKAIKEVGSHAGGKCGNQKVCG